jgi:hypothetical protein
MGEFYWLVNFYFVCWPLHGQPQYMANCDIKKLIYAIYGSILATSAAA